MPTRSARQPYLFHTFDTATLELPGSARGPIDPHYMFSWEAHGKAQLLHDIGHIWSDRFEWSDLAIVTPSFGERCSARIQVSGAPNTRDVYFSAIATDGSNAIIAENGPKTNLHGFYYNLELGFRPKSPFTWLRIGFWGHDGEQAYLLVDQVQVTCVGPFPPEWIPQ